MLRHEVFLLPQPNPMLTRTSAFHGNRPFDHPPADPRRFFHLLRVVGINQHDQMEIAVADMPNKWRQQSTLCNISFSGNDTICKL